MKILFKENRDKDGSEIQNLLMVLIWIIEDDNDHPF